MYNCKSMRNIFKLIIYTMKQICIIMNKTKMLLKKYEYFKTLYTFKNILIQKKKEHGGNSNLRNKM